MGSDVKSSDFTKKTTIADPAFIPFFENNTNFSIGFSDFLQSIGITVDLQSVGSSLGVPTMFQLTSTSYRFRNLESGSGVLVQTSPLNGIEIGLNLTQDVTGVPIFDDVGAVKPTVASLLAGAGMALSKVGNVITVSQIAAPVSTKTVPVSSLSDLPDPIAGVITLNANTDYLFLQDITTSSRFIVPRNVVIRAADSAIIKLTYTGTDTMFTGTDTNLKIEKIKLECATGTLFNITGTVPGTVFQMDDMTVSSCDVIGSLNNVSAVQIGNTAFDDIKTNGILFTGNIPVFIMERNLFVQNGGISMDLGSATFDGITAVTLFVTLAAGTTFLSGLPDSGNINIGGLGTLFNTRFSGPGDALSGITAEDALWDFFSNDDIQDTRADSLLSMIANATETVIDVATVPVKVAGIWTQERDSRFTTTTDGRSTYDGGRPAVLPITISLKAKMASGGAKTAGFQIALNGTVITGTLVTDDITSSASTRFTLIWQLLMNPNDFIEVFAVNLDDTVNVLAEDATIRIN